jgi:hypothetical protein
MWDAWEEERGTEALCCSEKERKEIEWVRGPIVRVFGLVGDLLASTSS